MSDPERFLASLGPLLVVAPHPDDESIGCGGLIALLRERAVPVSVVLLSDGSMSHPGSRRFPADARRALRWSEMNDALAELGVERAQLHAMGWLDGALPHRGSAAFDAAVAALFEVLRRCAARTLLVPWRRDPHPDHRAGHEIAAAANEATRRPARMLEYCVWAAERGTPAEQPRAGEADPWSLDISSVLPKKARAVAAHRSQHGEVIDDDAGGFILSTAMRARCALPLETYFEWRGPGTVVGR